MIKKRNLQIFHTIRGGTTLPNTQRQAGGEPVLLPTGVEPDHESHRGKQFEDLLLPAGVGLTKK